MIDVPFSIISHIQLIYHRYNAHLVQFLTLRTLTSKATDTWREWLPLQTAT